MIKKIYDLELITPCFCGGADPEKQAEIRASSIRGQLRWWFRSLGGFKSLAAMPLREQESLLFGAIAGDQGGSGKLTIRTTSPTTRSVVKDGQSLGHRNFSDPAYLTFPIQSREKNGQVTQFAGRGVIEGGSFQLIVLWRGTLGLWEDLQSLVSVLGHLGALGFRGRRAMGALSFRTDHPHLASALSRFANPGAIVIRSLGVMNRSDVIPCLGQWLRRWRSRGRSGNNQIEQKYPGFSMAESDHDQGVACLRRQSLGRSVYRAALGLPIIQFFSSTKATVNWEWNMKDTKANGRFASPVLLRPYRDAQGKWHALVIFVDAHTWPSGKKVFLNGQPRNVSPDLYEAMKKDKNLNAFPPFP